MDEYACLLNPSTACLLLRLSQAWPICEANWGSRFTVPPWFLPPRFLPLFLFPGLEEGMGKMKSCGREEHAEVEYWRVGAAEVGTLSGKGGQHWRVASGGLLLAQSTVNVFCPSPFPEMPSRSTHNGHIALLTTMVGVGGALRHRLWQRCGQYESTACVGLNKITPWVYFLKHD